MVYFGINPKFSPFYGTVISQQETLNGVYLPHQVIKNGHGDVFFAKKFSGIITDETKKKVNVEASPRNDMSRLVITPDIGNVTGKVLGADSFALGRNAFFNYLEISLPDGGIIYVAFRPRPSERRTMARPLVGKTIEIKKDQLFVLSGKGEKEAWPK